MKVNASEFMTTAWNMFVENHLSQTKLDGQDLLNKLSDVMVQKFGQQAPLDCLVLPNTPILKRRCKILAEFFIDRCAEYADGKNIKRSMLNRKFKEFKSKNHESVLHVEAALLYEFQNRAILDNSANRAEVIDYTASLLHSEVMSQISSGKKNNALGMCSIIENLMSDAEVHTTVELLDEVYVRNTLNPQEFEVFCILLDAVIQLDGFELVKFDDEEFDDAILIETNLSSIKNIVDDVNTFISVKQMQEIEAEKHVLVYKTMSKHSSVEMRLTICTDIESPYFGAASLECGFVVKDGTNKAQEFALQDISSFTETYYNQLETFQDAVFNSGLLVRT